MTCDGPIAELARLLSEKSLEERFQRVLVSVFRRISDGGYYPAGDFLKEIEAGNAVEFARNWLSDDRAQPLFDLLLLRNRRDLTVEWYVARPPYLRMFGQGDRDVYDQRLTAAMQKKTGWFFLRSSRAAPVPTNEQEFAEQAIANLGADRIYRIEDLIRLQRRRANEFGTLPIPEQVDSLEREIRSGYPFTCSGRLIRESNGLPVRDHHPLVSSGIEEVPQAIRDLFQPHLELYRPLFDFSPEKIATVDALLKRSEDLEGLRAEKVLSFRAAFLCSSLGQLIAQAAAIYFGDESDESEIRGLASYFSPPDARLLISAAILSRMFNEEDLATFRAISFGDLPESDLLSHEPFDPDKHKYREGLDDEYAQAVNLDAVVKFVAAYASRIASDGGAIVLPPARRSSDAGTGQSLVAIHDASAVPWEAMIEIAGKKKRAESERRLRTKMKALFDQLCPKARASLMGAEFTLLDEHWHPGASQALVAMGAAFEAQLKEVFLDPLVDFVSVRGLEPFPKQNTVITKDGGVKRGLTLDALRIGMVQEPVVWTQFCESVGIDFERIRRTIRQITDPRNQAAHEGNVSFDYVRECRDRWLDPVNGIFAALPSSNDSNGSNEGAHST